MKKILKSVYCSKKVIVFIKKGVAFHIKTKEK